MAKISSACEIFADKCVLNGYVPPHPGDLQRTLKEMNLLLAPSVLEVTPSKNNDENNKNTENENVQENITNTEPQNSTESITPTNSNDKFNTLSESFKNIPAEDLESIKTMAKGQKNALSQFSINKIHEKNPNIATKDIRNYIRFLISQGEIISE